MKKMSWECDLWIFGNKGVTVTGSVKTIQYGTWPILYSKVGKSINLELTSAVEERCFN